MLCFIPSSKLINDLSQINRAYSGAAVIVAFRSAKGRSFARRKTTFPGSYPRKTKASS